jgi:cytochrome c oxidase cbb3-type subunit 3
MKYAILLQTTEGSLLSPQMKNYIGYGAIILMILLFLIVMLMLLRVFKLMTRVFLKTQGLTDEQIAAELKPAKPQKIKKPKTEVWSKILSLHSLSEEKKLVMEHTYDGIQELDNPTPKWFMVLFYGTIAFAVCYLLIYQVFHIGPLQYDEYKNEMAQAAIEKQIYLSKAANRVDENTVKLTKEPAVLTDGQTVFTAHCTPCHGEHAQGIIGPNLTDDYWLHGGKINQVFTTIKYGVPSKGMPTWESQLTPKQIADVANYIKSLHGSSPANPKAPQGEKEND